MEYAKTEILSELLADIDNKAFDLEAWKKKAILILKKIFGDKDDKIGMIENLHYEFSSWSLRDSSGGTSYDKVKENARKIIEAASAELLLAQGDNLVLEIVKEELTGKELTALQSIIEEPENNFQALTVYFSKMSSEKKDQLLAALVTRSRG
jgi:hypothetical protein